MGRCGCVFCGECGGVRRGRGEQEWLMKHRHLELTTSIYQSTAVPLYPVPGTHMVHAAPTSQPCPLSACDSALGGARAWGRERSTE
eukprot:2079458-Rhodomonas_salina.1